MPYWLRFRPEARNCHGGKRLPDESPQVRRNASWSSCARQVSLAFPELKTTAIYSDTTQTSLPESTWTRSQRRIKAFRATLSRKSTFHTTRKTAFCLIFSKIIEYFRFACVYFLLKGLCAFQLWRRRSLRCRWSCIWCCVSRFFDDFWLIVYWRLKKKRMEVRAKMKTKFGYYTKVIFRFEIKKETLILAHWRHAMYGRRRLRV